MQTSPTAEYGTTACHWDSVIPFEPLWAQYKRIIKPRGAIVLFGSQPFTSALVMSNIDWFKYCWVWEKQQPTGFLHVKDAPMKSHEDIVIFSLSSHSYNPQGTKSVFVKNGRANKSGNGCYRNVNGENYIQTIGNYPRSILKFDRVTHSQIHPTQKPVALLAYLIRTYTNEGETVLDNTMGSGSTIVAAIQEGRNAIGIERDADYFAIAQKRCLEATYQPSLFAPEPQQWQTSPMLED